MKKVHLSSALVVIALLLAASIPLAGQAVNFAEIHGRITDSAGAALGGAGVKATQVETGLVRNTITSADGHYALTALPIGAYEIRLSAKGFRDYLQKGINLQVGASPEIDVIMKVGTVAETVEVNADATMVETHENTISSLIDNDRIMEMPLNGRNVPDLIMISGGSSDNSVPSQDLNSTKNYGNNLTGATKPVSVGGSQENSNNFLLDGGDHNDAFSNVNAPFPFPDAIQEFSVNSSGLSARFGVHSGATVNAVTKSGTNRFHGEVFEFIRNPILNAKHWVSQPLPPGQKDDTQKRNQFGGTVGGPIVRDKLMFFAGFQGTRIRQTPAPTTAIVPTAAALTGDFSTMFGGALQPDGKTCPSKNLTGTYNGYTFASKKINPLAFNGSSVNLTGLLPAAVDACGNTSFFVPQISNEDMGVTKLDWIVSQKHQIFTRYYITDSRNPVTYDGTNVLTQGTGTSSSQYSRYQSLVLGDSYSFTPHLLNSVHLTGTRLAINRLPASNMITPASIGVPLLDQATQTGISQPIPIGMVLSVSSYFTVGGGSNMPGHFINNLYQVADDVDWIKGRHQISFGANLMRMQLNYLSTFQSNGQYTFGAKKTGDNLADFMVGYVSNFAQGNPEAENWRYTYMGYYVQDAFKVTPRFTVNLGLRWEPYLPSGDAFHRGSHFDYGAFVAGTHSTVFPNAPAGLFYCGDAGIPCKFANNKWKQFAPRAGVVWDPRGKGNETIRASYGIFFDSPEMYYFDRYADNSPYGSGVSFTPTFASGGNFTNPYKGQPGTLPFFPQPFPNPGSSSAYFPLNGVYINNPLTFSPMYTQNWNLSVEEQMGPNWMFSMSYIGNKSTHVWVAYEANPGMPVNVPSATNGCTLNQAPSTSNVNCRRSLFVANPAQGQYFSNVTSLWDGANAEYNGLLLSARHRFAQHYTLLTNYTWSHCISDQDFSGELTNSRPDLYTSPFSNPNLGALSGDRGACAFDVRQFFNASLVTTAPKFAGVKGALLSNWQLAPLVKYRTGQPLTVTTGVDSGMQGTTTSFKDRPNYGTDANSKSCPAGAAAGSYQCYFDINAYTTTGLGAGLYGNVPRNSLRGPGAFNLDAALSRKFVFRERKELTFRLELFNVFNHPNLGNPNTSMSSSSFGQVTAENGDPRVFQGALKFAF